MEIEDLGERVDYIENKMTDFTNAHNKLVDDHFALKEEVKQLKLKVADLEDRSKRNNVKLRGIPENVKNNYLKKFLQKVIIDLIPTLQNQELVIDRAHRLLKPPHILEKLPRDVIDKIHFFLNERFADAIRKAPHTTPRSLCRDNLATILARKNLNLITKILHNHKIIYRWAFPTKLIIESYNMSHSIYTIEEGLKTLKMCRLLPNEESISTNKNPKEKMTSPWNASHE